MAAGLEKRQGTAGAVHAGLLAALKTVVSPHASQAQGTHLVLLIELFVLVARQVPAPLKISRV